MKIADLIVPDRVVVPMHVSDKAQLLRELSRRSARLLTIDPQAILDALQTREAQRPRPKPWLPIPCCLHDQRVKASLRERRTPQPFMGH